MHLERLKDWIMVWRVTEIQPSSSVEEEEEEEGKRRFTRTAWGRRSRFNLTVIFSLRDSLDSFSFSPLSPIAHTS